MGLRGTHGERSDESAVRPGDPSGDDLSPDQVARLLRVLDRLTSTVLLRQVSRSAATSQAVREELVAAFADLFEHLLEVLDSKVDGASLEPHKARLDAAMQGDSEVEIINPPSGTSDEGPEVDGVLVFGEFAMNALRRQLTRSGETLEVQPRVLELLHYLALNPCRTVTREELMRRVWPDVCISDSTLNYTVSRMRRVLGHQAEIWLQTVRGRGYRFVAKVRQVPSSGDRTAV